MGQKKKKTSGQKIWADKIKNFKYLLENVEEHVSEFGSGYQEKQRPTYKFQLSLSFEQVFFNLSQLQFPHSS